MSTKPKRGRPATTGRTPDAQRSAKSLENLKKAGGRRLNVNLSPEAAAALDAIKARDGNTTTEAVHKAVTREAARKR